jgi:hypothetical protein
MPLPQNLLQPDLSLLQPGPQVGLLTAIFQPNTIHPLTQQPQRLTIRIPRSRLKKAWSTQGRPRTPTIITL